jgi:hypothetical protein
LFKRSGEPVYLTKNCEEISWPWLLETFARRKLQIPARVMVGYCKLDKQKCSIITKINDWTIMIAAAQAQVNNPREK